MRTEDGRLELNEQFYGEAEVKICVGGLSSEQSGSEERYRGADERDRGAEERDMGAGERDRMVGKIDIS